MQNQYWQGANDQMRNVNNENPMDTSNIDILKDDLEYQIKSAVKSNRKSIINGPQMQMQ